MYSLKATIRFCAICAALSAVCLAVVCESCVRPVSGQRGGDTLVLRHARLLHIVSCGAYSVATVSSPWRADEVLNTYVLVPAGNPLPAGLPEGTVVRVPLRRVAVFSSVYCGLLASLGRIDALAGVGDYRYVLTPAVRRRVEQGLARDVGPASRPDVESIASLGTDALVVSSFPGAGGYGKLSSLGIPIIECVDYMESSPLARAEWMRFFGLLFGCGNVADSLFSSVERRYCELREAASVTKSRPSLMCDLQEGAAWYVPGGASTIGRAFADAGARYVFGNDSSAGSLGLTFEKVYGAARNADVWVIRHGAPHNLTYDDLRREREGYSRFRPWRERRVYLCNTFKVPFFDESPFRPDFLLEDLVRILHPGLLRTGQLRYFEPMN